MIGIGNRFSNGIYIPYYYEEKCVNQCFLGNGSIGNQHFFDMTCLKITSTVYTVDCKGDGYFEVKEEGFDYNLIFNV